MFITLFNFTCESLDRFATAQSTSALAPSFPSTKSFAVFCIQASTLISVSALASILFSSDANSVSRAAICSSPIASGSKFSSRALLVSGASPPAFACIRRSRSAFFSSKSRAASSISSGDRKSSSRTVLCAAGCAAGCAVVVSCAAGCAAGCAVGCAAGCAAGCLRVPLLCASGVIPPRGPIIGTCS